MKRASLVDYPSSEEDAPAQKKKRKTLPPLSSSLTVPAPVDDPALHQGRVRTVPHVQGQYATYVYVPLVLHRTDALCKLVEGALALARAHVPFLHPVGKQEQHEEGGWELHVSLSRPLFLRAHQRDEFKRAVRRLAAAMAPFDASFTTFSDLANDEGTRAFLALEVGAGYDELRHCLDLLEPTLRALHQKAFYRDPKFHASIAWALLDKTLAASSAVPVGELDAECAAPEEQRTRSASPRTMEQPSSHFDRIPHFPHVLVPSLNEAYAAKLSQARIGGFVVDRIAARIGKDVFTCPFG